LVVIVYILSMITAFMLCLLVIVLLLHRSMKLLERIVDVLSQPGEPDRELEKPSQE